MKNEKLKEEGTKGNEIVTRQGIVTRHRENLWGRRTQNLKRAAHTMFTSTLFGWGGLCLGRDFRHSQPLGTTLARAEPNLKVHHLGRSSTGELYASTPHAQTAKSGSLHYASYLPGMSCTAAVL